MQESFLHFIWRFQYFDKTGLQTESHENLAVFSSGFYNTNSGPDFLNARVRVGEITWVGNVEIHIKSSAWHQHGHQQDSAYQNVILHVVWENDRQIYREDGSMVPTLTLKDKVDTDLLKTYLNFSLTNHIVPCNTYLSNLPSIVKTGMLEKALISRLERKGLEIIQQVEKNKGDWEETSYQWLCKNFGFKINSEPFLRLATSIPFRLIRKHCNSQLQIEALLFGQAGFLERTFHDEYLQNLKTEYRFLQHKYDLQNPLDNLAEWKFMRMRPGNFPTVRIAQLSEIFKNLHSVYSLMAESENPESIIKALSVKPSAYWQNHFLFEKEAKTKGNHPGRESLINIVINTAVPLMAATGINKGLEEFIEKGVYFLTLLPSENNKITRQWESSGLQIKTAADSQGSIELFNSFCKRRLCLNCNIGHQVIKKECSLAG